MRQGLVAKWEEARGRRRARRWLPRGRCASRCREGRRARCSRARGTGSSDATAGVMGLTPTVLLCVACASSFSFLLGYDIGIMSGAKRLIRADLALSEPQLELLVGILNLVSGPGGLLSGRLADSMGRRPSAQLACVVTLAGSLMMAAAPTYALLLCGRVLTGVGVGCCFHVAPLYLTEVAPKDVRGKLVSFFECALAAKRARATPHIMPPAARGRGCSLPTRGQPRVFFPLTSAEDTCCKAEAPTNCGRRVRLPPPLGSGFCQLAAPAHAGMVFGPVVPCARAAVCSSTLASSSATLSDGPSRRLPRPRPVTPARTRRPGARCSGWGPCRLL